MSQNDSKKTFSYVSNIEVYKELLTEFRENKDDKYKNFIVRNDSFAHAKALFSEIVSHSSDDLLLNTTALFEKFYTDEEVQSALKAFFSNGSGEVHIIVADPNIENVKRVICEKYKDYIDRIEIKKGNVVLEYKEKKNIGNDFLVTGDAFRYETSNVETGDMKKSGFKPEALGSFHDEATAKMFKDAFEDAWNSDELTKEYSVDCNKIGEKEK
jgi:hypothetical protein